MAHLCIAPLELLRYGDRSGNRFRSWQRVAHQEGVLPTEIYSVASTILSWLVSFFIEMLVLSFTFLLWGKVVFQWLPLVFLVSLFQAVFGLGSRLPFALNVYFRDIQHLIGIVLQIWFYLTPIVYSQSVYITSSPWTAIYKINPMVHFVTAYRNLLFDGRLPGVESIAFLVLGSAVSLTVGTLIFRKLEPRMVEEL